MQETYIKLYRKLMEWEWYQDSKMVHLFIHLLIKANFKDGSWQGIAIKRGQLVTGLHSLNRQTGINIQSLRTCIKKLKSTNDITVQSTNQFSTITLCNYNTYQSFDVEDNKQINKPANKRATSDQQATNKQLTTNNKDNKDNKKEEGNKINTIPKEVIVAPSVPSFKKLTETEFYNSIAVFKNDYSKEMLRAFYNYWSEKNDKAIMRFQLQKTWELKKRLTTWDLSDKKNTLNGTHRKVPTGSNGKLGTSAARIATATNW